MSPRSIFVSLAFACALSAQSETAPQDRVPSLAELKVEGARRSSYLGGQKGRQDGAQPAGPDLETYRTVIRPILAKNCFACHGPEEDEAGLRIDELDPDLFDGEDVDWWLEVQGVLTNGEMPPEDDVTMPGEDRAKVIDWLSAQSQAASAARRGAAEHRSFRRMARYEYNHALQDLLGLPFDFAEDLPPDPVSEDGFENSSEMLHLSGLQFRTYLESARKALRLATVTGERPAPLYWSVPMAALAAGEWKRQEQQLDKLRKKHKDDPDKLQKELDKQRARNAKRPGGAFYHDRSTGRMARQRWGYNGARHARKPMDSAPEAPAASDVVAVLPQRQTLVVELGDRIPERGNLRVRVRAWTESNDPKHRPELRLLFGWQASNDSQANVRVSDEDLVVMATAQAPRIYEWNVPLSQVYPRNSVRGINKMGDLPSPSEYLKIVNAARSGADVIIDHVEVVAPAYDSWPPASHTRIFFESDKVSGSDRLSGADRRVDEAAYAREVIEAFLARAWRRRPTEAEVARKLRLFEKLRPECESFEEAMVEVLAAALASPHFLYVAAAGLSQREPEAVLLTAHEVATRLSMFLWCSTPDEKLRHVADTAGLYNPVAVEEQVRRMLADPKARRFSEHFVRQWLNLELLDFLHVDKKFYSRFDGDLKRAMREEPVAFFAEVLANDLSVLEFLHADFTVANERLAEHYGIKGVRGNHLRRVSLPVDGRRGGLLTLPGLLAMNSDGKDSHPLKRGIWMLERILDDPPPPPPPAVPEIDLADPRIAKMTLKERIEDHRNHAACRSCHAKIDPWGIAFENFDAVGRWRTEVQGRPVDAVSYLFNKQKLDGMDGLKRFLLANRQDQFVRALVHKLATFALGRPLGFGDRAAIDEITAEARKRGDGLATIVTLIATSDLFRSK